MIALSCENISLSYGTDVILDKVSFGINEGEKLGIVGVNGAGKSTLFKIINGEINDYEGKVYFAKEKSIGFLDQNLNFDADGTVLEQALSEFKHLIESEHILDELKRKLDTGHTELADEFSRMHENFVSAGGYEYEGRVKGMLKSMGLPETVWNMRISNLSGGQKTRLAISCLLLQEPDILMLDEPTNHLDTDALEWLEDFIRLYKKTVLIISHDRYFLDRTSTKILEIENCHGTLYNGNYSAYVKQKETDREIRQRHYNNQQKEIARIEAYIEQQRRWNRERNIIAAESRQKQLDKMVKVEKVENLPEKIRLSFDKGLESGNDVLMLRSVGAGYGDKILYRDFSCEIHKKEHVFIVGENGCGKSTLIKTIVGKIPTQKGYIEFGTNVKFGYYDQENQQLNEDNTVMDELWDSFEKLTQTEIRSALALFLFKGEDVEKKVSILSGGEKARLTLAKLVLLKNNLLILDEPTNHLDINSREALENALLQYDGTIIAVSHDRYFINKLSGRILGFDSDKSGHITDFKGNFTEYRDYVKNKKQTSDNPSCVSMQPTSAGKEQYLSDKKEIAEKRKAENRIIRAKKECAEIEAKIEAIDNEMQTSAAANHIRLAELYAEKEKFEERLLELYEITEA